ncbi:MAG: OmpA family protein [Rhodobacterales bacterium]|nr:OmpA family protein [Rhodobacterales bacterium]
MSIQKVLAIALLASAIGCQKKAPEVVAPDPKPAVVATKPAPATEVSYFGPVVSPVLFETGGTVIDAAQMSAIDEAVEVLKSSDWSVIVVGLADAVGDAASNKTLSQGRADVVAAELLTRSGVPQSRIIAHGVGEKLATGQRQSERKTEFIFFTDKGHPMKQVVIRSGVLEEDFRAKKAAE